MKRTTFISMEVEVYEDGKQYQFRYHNADGQFCSEVAVSDSLFDVFHKIVADCKPKHPDQMPIPDFQLYNEASSAGQVKPKY